MTPTQHILSRELDAVIAELESTRCPFESAWLRLRKSALEHSAMDVN